MRKLDMNTGLTFGAELDDKKIRLIIYRNNIELVCRKTTLREIIKFLDGADDKLFKGRLQLLKNEGYIVISIKNDTAGVLNRQVFTKHLASM